MMITYTKAEDFGASDLRKEAQKLTEAGEPWQGAKIWEDNQEKREYLYCDISQSCGVAHVAQADWFNASSLDAAIDTYEENIASAK